jgi:hypothetical protein
MFNFNTYYDLNMFRIQRYVSQHRTAYGAAKTDSSVVAHRIIEEAGAIRQFVVLGYVGWDSRYKKLYRDTTSARLFFSFPSIQGREISRICPDIQTTNWGQ